ncbi:MAG: hypothetical protein QOJ09_28 [Actinomycetota bacterium]|jgi:hypothetical protein|nr:hypothetical protein [Actinomycetota bacterium]
MATAVAGVVVGHGAAYAIAFPAGASRAAELHATGHGYWGGAVIGGVAAAVLALVAVGWRAAHRADVGVRFLPLAVGQVALFATAEAAERTAAGVPLAGLAHAPEFAIGLLLQVVVAAVAVTVLRRWGRLVAAFTAPTPVAADPARLPIVAATTTFVARVPRSSTRTRAPPRLALA